MARVLTVREAAWPTRAAFTISRGSKNEARVLICEITDEAGHVGRGECVPYGRYGETIDGVRAEIEGVAAAIADGMDRAALQTALHCT